MTVRRRVLLVVFLSLALAVAVWLAGGRARDPGAPLRATIHRQPADSAWIFEFVDIETDRGPTLHCASRRPAGSLPTARLPAALVAGGYRTGKRAANAVGSSFTGVTLSCDYLFPNPGQLGAPSLVLRLPRLRSDIVSTPLAHRTALTWLLSQPYVDSTRVVAIGVSLGVTTIAAWAANDARVRAVALLYGGARLDVMLERAAQRAAWPAGIRLALAPLVARALSPLEPERTVPRLAPRPVFVAIAPDDERIPRESGEALAAAAGPGARVLRLEGRHVTPRADDLFGMLTDSTTAWLARVWEPAR